jgi:shikimate dehydrogenase
VTHRCGVLGSPVAHSLSPSLHAAGYAAQGLVDWSYERIECTAEQLPQLVAQAGPEWVGWSVTMPGKAAAAAVATHRSDRVRLLGVANTLYRTGDGWAAENTDVDGVREALRAHGLTAPRRSLLLGGGHTARAVVAALAELGAGEVVLAGRRPTSTAGCAATARELGLEVQEIGFDPAAVGAAAEGCDLVVSTVPAGGADALAGAVARVPALLDVVYAPWPTALAVAAADRVTVTGLDMLQHQAFRQFELFTGFPAPRSAMRAGLLAASGSSLPLPL